MTQRVTATAVVVSLLASIVAPSQSMAGNDGISRLIAVTQIKTENANNNAMRKVNHQPILVRRTVDKSSS